MKKVCFVILLAIFFSNSFAYSKEPHANMDSLACFGGYYIVKKKKEDEEECRIFQDSIQGSKVVTQKTKTITLKVTYPKSSPKKKQLQAYDFTLFSSYNKTNTVIDSTIVLSELNTFTFSSTIEHPLFFRIGGLSSFSSFSGILIEPGDNIDIVLSDRMKATYSGKGSEKLNCLNEIHDKYSEYKKNKLSKGLTLAGLKSFDSSIKELLKIIQGYKNQISPSAFTLIAADCISMYGEYLMDMNEDAEIDKSSLKNSFLSFVNLANAYINVKRGSDSVLAYSRLAPNMLKDKILLEEYFNKGGLYNRREFRFEYFSILDKSLPKGLLRDNILGRYLNWVLSNNPFNPDVAKACEQFVQTSHSTPSLRFAIDSLLRLAKSRFSKGAPSYDFELRDTSNKVVRMSDLKGKVVLLDFMFTGCGGCMQMVPYLKQIEKQFETDAKVQFVSVSVDVDIKRFINSASKGIYSVPGSLQLYTNGEGYNCSITNYYNVVTYPFLILIDQEGKIFSYGAPDPRFDNGAALTQLIKDALNKS